MNRMYVTARFGVLIDNQTITKLTEGDTSLNDDDRIWEQCDGLLHITNDNLAQAYNFLPAHNPTVPTVDITNPDGFWLYVADCQPEPFTAYYADEGDVLEECRAALKDAFGRVPERLSPENVGTLIFGEYDG